MRISLEDAYDLLDDEERFSSLIDSFAVRLGAQTYAGGWSSINSVQQIVAFKGFDEAAVREYLTSFAHVDPWTKAYLRNPVDGQFVNMLDYVDCDTYAASTLYRDFFLPRGMDVFYAVGFTTLTDGTHSGLTFHRGKKTGEFDRAAIAEVNEDAQDLRRLFHLKVRMSKLANRADEWDDLVSRFDVELYLVERSGLLVECNDKAREMLDDCLGLSVRDGRLEPTDADARASLSKIIEAAANNTLDGTDSITVGSDKWRRRLFVIPLRRVSGGQRFALFGEALKELSDNRENNLRQVFNLSPVEASIMVRLANGESPKEISRSRAVSPETTKTQYRSAIRKMNCRTLMDAIIAVRRLPSLRS